jgi:hypothetical protein
MKKEDLNEKKTVISLGIVSTLILFIVSMKNGNGLFASIVFSLLAVVPIMWVVGLTLWGIYEILVKPIRNWFFR